MALVVKDRVKETTTTTGTGTITLAGASTGYQSFAAIGDGNQTYYVITDTVTGDWEVGVGTYTSSGTTLSRTTILSSSNNGSPVSFGAGIKDVFVAYPAGRSVYLNAAGSAVDVLDIGTLGAGTINVTTANITSGTVSTTPTSGTDIANKTYVDNLVASGITYHAPVKYEVPSTTGNLVATYNNGTAGVGATLTNAGTLGAFTPDGVVAQVGERVLIYNQTNAFENGVYTVTTVGSGSVAWVLTRATDADSYGLKSPNSLGEGDAFFVTSGNTGAGETYICNTQGTITFGTTAINFVQVSSAQVYSAGTGLTLTGTQFSITNTGVSANTYGTAADVPVFAVNAQGQITSVTNTPIAISGAAVSGNISGSAGSVANSLTAGTYLTGGTFNGSTPVTFTVDATSSNTASKVVARDSSGNFSAGTITASLSGNATTATTATNVAGGTANQIPYQSSASTTTFAPAPTASGQLLVWNGSAFVWVGLDGGVTGTLPIGNGGTNATTAGGARTNLSVPGLADANTFTNTNTFSGTTHLGGAAGAESLRVAPVTSAVNYLQASGSTVGADVALSAAGSDTDINLNLVSKGAGVVEANGVPVVTTTGTQTLTNKRVTTRSVDIVSAATITPTGDTADQYEVTALATAATIAAPSGTPTDGQKLILRIKDNGTARALTWTTTSGAYRAVGVSLPTTTVLGKVLYVGCIYNSQDVFWDVVAVAQQA